MPKLHPLLSRFMKDCDPEISQFNENLNKFFVIVAFTRENLKVIHDTPHRRLVFPLKQVTFWSIVYWFFSDSS